MISAEIILTLLHLFGLAMGTGAATVKLTLLFKCKTNHDFVPVFNNVARPITKTIISGLILVTLSGVIWLILGASWNSTLVIKILLVILLWILGPYIDNVVEPKFRKLSPSPGQQALPEFLKIQKKYLLIEGTATILFYIIIFMGVMLYE